MKSPPLSLGYAFKIRIITTKTSQKTDRITDNKNTKKPKNDRLIQIITNNPSITIQKPTNDIQRIDKRICYTFNAKIRVIEVFL